MIATKQPIVSRKKKRETKVFTSAQLREMWMTPKEQDEEREIISQAQRYIEKWSAKGRAEEVEAARLNIEQRERRLELVAQLDDLNNIDILRSEIAGLDETISAFWNDYQDYRDIDSDEERREKLLEELDEAEFFYQRRYDFDIVVINPRRAR